MKPDQVLNYSLRVRIHKGEPFFGPGVMELLRRVDDSGSLQTAAAQMRMSYSKAWKIVRKAEQSLGYPLTIRRTGGAGGGSSHLTERGRDFLERYAAFERQIHEAADRLFLQIFEGSGEPTAAASQNGKEPDRHETDRNQGRCRPYPLPRRHSDHPGRHQGCALPQGPHRHRGGYPGVVVAG